MTSTDLPAPGCGETLGAGSPTWELRLPLTSPLSLNSRQHWAKKARETRALRDAVCLLAKKIPPQPHVTVSLIWYPKDRRKRDSENPVPTLKASCDGLVDAKVVPDDTPQWMTKLMPHIAEPDGDPRLVLVVASRTPKQGEANG